MAPLYPRDPHLLYLQQRFDEGCRNAMQLWRDIRPQGFPGTYRPVTRWLWLRRESLAFNTPPHRLDEICQQTKAAVQAIIIFPLPGGYLGCGFVK